MNVVGMEIQRLFIIWFYSSCNLFYHYFLTLLIKHKGHLILTDLAHCSFTVEPVVILYSAVVQLVFILQCYD